MLIETITEMKKVLIILCVLATNVVLAQSSFDVYQYSQEGTYGDARYMATGGAFSALGGNMYGITQNPAGLAVYLNNSMDFSLGVDVHSTLSPNGGNANELTGKLLVPNLGLVLASKPNDSKWKALNFAYNYNRINNWQQNSRFNHTNSTSSLADYFAEQASGYYDTDFDANTDYPALPFSSFLAYQGYLISPTDTGSTDYYTEVGNGTVSQNINISEQGYMNQSNFSFAANYNNKLYIGVGIGLLSSSYSQSISHYEKLLSDSARLQSFTYNTNLNTESGIAVNASLGAIYRITKSLRASVHFKTGNIMHLQESYSSSLTTVFNDSLGEIHTTSPEYAPYSYRVKTPPSFGGGLAYIFKKRGAVSIEYSQKHIGMGNIRPYTGFDAEEVEQHADYSLLNDEITRSFTRQHTYKIGGEIKIENIAFRLGGNYVTTGFATSEAETNYSPIITYTAGFGYMVGYWRFDFGAALSKYSTNFSPYQVGFAEAPQFEIEHTKVQVGASIALQF